MVTSVRYIDVMFVWRTLVHDLFALIHGDLEIGQDYLDCFEFVDATALIWMLSYFHGQL